MSPPITPPFKRSKLDLIKRIKSNVEVAFKEAILKAVRGQKGLKKTFKNLFFFKCNTFFDFLRKNYEMKWFLRVP